MGEQALPPISTPNLDESVKLLIQEASENKVRAYIFDNEISSDALKYSSWITAAATAGLGIIVTRFGDIIKTPILGQRTSFFLVLAAAAFLFAGIVTGAVYHSKTNRLISLRRQFATAVLRQKVDLLASGPDERNATEVLGAILSFKYMSEYNRAHAIELRRERATLIRVGSQLMFFQQIATAAGYLLLFVAAIPGLPG
jgi:hypothetical protein